MPTTDRTPRVTATVSHLAARVTSAWVLVAVLCAVGLSFTVDGSAGAAPAAGRHQPCQGAEGITVVVDFQGEGGRSVETGCAPGSPGTGLEALHSAGFPVEPSLEFPTAVCQIDGAPASAQCRRMPPASAFWSYWVAPTGGSWSFSNVGAASRTPKPGTTEGWSFARNKSTPSAPGSAPPPPPSTTPPTSPPVTRAPRTGGGGSSSGGSQSGGNPGGGARPTGPGPQTSAGGTTKRGETSTNKDEAAIPGKGGTAGSDGSDQGDGKPSKSGTTTPGDDADGAESSADTDDSATDEDDAPNSDETAAGRAADSRLQRQRQTTNAAETRRATNAADEDRGSPVPLIFAAVAAVVLLGTGIRASRRNRAAS